MDPVSTLRPASVGSPQRTRPTWSCRMLPAGAFDGSPNRASVPGIGHVRLRACGHAEELFVPVPRRMTREPPALLRLRPGPAAGSGGVWQHGSPLRPLLFQKFVVSRSCCLSHRWLQLGLTLLIALRAFGPVSRYRGNGILDGVR